MNEEQPKKTSRKVLFALLSLFILLTLWLAFLDLFFGVFIGIILLFVFTPLIVATVKGAKRGAQISALLFLVSLFLIFFGGMGGGSLEIVYFLIIPILFFALSLIFGAYHAFSPDSQTKVIANTETTIKEPDISMDILSQSLSQVLLKETKKGSMRSFTRTIIMFIVITVATGMFSPFNGLGFFAILFFLIILLNLGEMLFMISQKFTGWANGILKVSGFTLLLLSFSVYAQIAYVYSHVDFLFFFFVVFVYWKILTHAFVKFFDKYKK